VTRPDWLTDAMLSYLYALADSGYLSLNTPYPLLAWRFELSKSATIEAVRYWKWARERRAD